MLDKRFGSAYELTDEATVEDIALIVRDLKLGFPVTVVLPAHSVNVTFTLLSDGFDFCVGGHKLRSIGGDEKEARRALDRLVDRVGIAI